MNLSLQRRVTVPVYEVLWNPNDFNAVPVPVLEKFRFRLRFGIQTIFSTVFHRKKIVQNLAISMLGSSTVPMKLASHLVIVTFVFHFMLDPDPNPVPECIPACAGILEQSMGLGTELA
jgi:hypothetical protein